MLKKNELKNKLTERINIAIEKSSTDSSKNNQSIPIPSNSFNGNDPNKDSVSLITRSIQNATAKPQKITHLNKNKCAPLYQRIP